mmetsp:Transcript_8823/g.8954  ORF Transcript_8823/g.8954 Transcript_8823/m.8954 type:complete len:249 (-) Transcript_8823:586-1332(-)
MEFCKWRYSLGAPLSTAPSVGTMYRMNSFAKYPMIPASSPGSENSRMASRPPVCVSLSSVASVCGFFKTRNISQKAMLRSVWGTFRIPKDMVMASYALLSTVMVLPRGSTVPLAVSTLVSLSSRCRFLESPRCSDTTSCTFSRTSFCRPISIMLWDGSTPSTVKGGGDHTSIAPSFSSIGSVELPDSVFVGTRIPRARSSFPSRMATSAVPVARSSIRIPPLVTPPPPSPPPSSFGTARFSNSCSAIA